jgi:hypothetical protein
MTITFANYGFAVENGEYYLGVFIDPEDRIEERDETDNQRTTGQSYFIGDGGSGSLAADAFEPDSNSAEPTALPTYSPQYHTLHLAGEEDWFSRVEFTAVTPGTYFVKVIGFADEVGEYSIERYSW